MYYHRRVEKNKIGTIRDFLFAGFRPLQNRVFSLFLLQNCQLTNFLFELLCFIAFRQVSLIVIRMSGLVPLTVPKCVTSHFNSQPVGWLPISGGLTDSQNEVVYLWGCWRFSWIPHCAEGWYAFLMEKLGAYGGTPRGRGIFHWNMSKFLRFAQISFIPLCSFQIFSHSWCIVHVQ